jgi:hypothetical protein
MKEDNKDLKPIDIFKDAIGVNDWVKNKYPKINARHALISCINSILKWCPTLFKLNKKALMNWKRVGADTRAEKKKNGLNQELTETQKNGMVRWEEVKAMCDKFAKEEYGSKRHLLLAMYSIIPPMRNDYDRVKIYPSVKSVTPEQKNKINYLVLTPSKATIYINQYKTASTYGKHILELPNELTRIIRANQESIKPNKRGWLFTDKSDNPFPEDREAHAYSSWICIVYKEIWNRNFNTTLMRHSYLSSKELLSKPLAERVEIAIKYMKHSYLTQQSYIVTWTRDNVPVDGTGEKSSDIGKIIEEEDDDDPDGLL